MVPLESPSQFAVWPVQRVAPCFLLGLVLLLIALGLLLSIRSDYGYGVISSTTIAPLPLSEVQPAFNSPDFDLHFDGFERSSNLASILTGERRSDHRGSPDQSDLPPVLLFIALAPITLLVSWRTQRLEDDSPRAKLRVCRARPPTFSS
jgi:hypothetical protein